MSDIFRRSFLSAAAAAGSLPAVSAAKASQKFDLTTDVLIAGGGAAGCMAAVEAAKKVLLVQAGAMLGGSSAISSGWICATNTVWHEKRGIKAWTSQQRCTQAFGSAFIS